MKKEEIREEVREEVAPEAAETEVATPETVDTPKQEEEKIDLPDMDKLMSELKLGEHYNIHLLAQQGEDEDGKPIIKRAILGQYNLETITYGDTGEIIHRFQALFNQTLFFLDKNGTPQGDFRGWIVEKIEIAEPVFVKRIQMTESAMVEKINEAFGENSGKVFEFIKNL